MTHRHPTGEDGWAPQPRAATFAGVGLRRVHLALGGEPRTILVHEPGGEAAFLLDEPGSVFGAPLVVRTVRGEPLGRVEAVRATGGDGRILAYRVGGRGGASAELDARHAAWWQGQLLCHPSRAAALRAALRAGALA